MALVKRHHLAADDSLPGSMIHCRWTQASRDRNICHTYFLLSPLCVQESHNISHYRRTYSQRICDHTRVESRRYCGSRREGYLACVRVCGREAWYCGVVCIAAWCIAAWRTGLAGLGAVA